MRRSILGATVVLCLLAASGSVAEAVTVHQWNTTAPQFINPKDYSSLDTVNGKLVTNVVLPTGYSNRKCWPVLYLLHGTADSSESPSKQWLQINDGELLKMNIPAILVIPGSGDSWWVNNWWNGYRHPAWASWIMQYIVPLVGKRLHVCPGRSEHAIAGLSMGGYGAVYLASQLPSYFGSAGSFSGVLSPETNNFLKIYPTFSNYWGPADRFYAIGQDPIALVSNLKHTRVFVSAGNGVPTAGDSTEYISIFEEKEFDTMSKAFTAKAKAAGVSATFEQLAGTHSPNTWFAGLSGMLKWNPFKKVVSDPSSWTYSTVLTTGSAWNYKFDFNHASGMPNQIIQFSKSGRLFKARGGGIVKLTQPNGKTVTARIPFNIRKGKLMELRRAPKPHLVGGYSYLRALDLAVKVPSTSTGSVGVSFKTGQKLPSNQQYEIIVTSASTSCESLGGTRVSQPGLHREVSAQVAPQYASTSKTWCAGPAYVVILTVDKGSSTDSFNQIVVFKKTTLP